MRMDADGRLGPRRTDVIVKQLSGGPSVRAAAVFFLAIVVVAAAWADDAVPATGPRRAVRSTAAPTAAPTAARRRRGDGGTGVGSGHEPVGCTSAAGSIVTGGDGARHDVALSFDDGPSLVQTRAILAILDRFHVHATFFEEGRHVHGREALMQEILASGDEIGNHSYHHPRYPGYGDLASTDRRIREATGFEPCLFRPPYGLIDGKVEAAARRAGLEMVLWTLDSHDDHHPGVAAIRANVLGGAAPGSIILMHDGGHHPQTVRALPGVIRGLRARGFGFATVTELLGGRMIYADRGGHRG
jgi:peptidoglycan/xylan/chitin deacetylase (PgdA/CDA1 family)